MGNSSVVAVALALVVAAQQQQCQPPPQPGNPGGGGSRPPATTPGVYGGNCSTAFPAVSPTGSWRRLDNRFIVSKAAPVLHRALDVVVDENEDFTLEAKFAYGPTDKDLEGEDVEVWVRRCPGWEKLGSHRTGGDFVFGEGGWASHDVTAGTYSAGDYRVRWLVRADGTFAEGTLAVWRPGVRAIVTDIDGTLTTDDVQLFTDVLGGGTAAMYPDADKVMQEYASAGYRIVYLTGRPAALERYTRDWLAKKGMPWGIVRVTSHALSVVPADFGVQAFKAAFLEDLIQNAGVVFDEAYGNATTDIGAYADAGIAKTHTWIIGPNAGKDGTQAVSDYPSHLAYVRGLPRAVQP